MERHINCAAEALFEFARARQLRAGMPKEVRLRPARLTTVASLVLRTRSENLCFVSATVYANTKRKA